MTEINRVKINDLVESQIPEFLNEESPLFKSFLKQYYISMESQSGSIDLAANIKKYKDLQIFTDENLSSQTTLTSEVLTFDSTISVISTIGWPEKYGLLKIDNEIITYTSKTDTTFEGCIRGFSGIDQIKSPDDSEYLNFISTEASEHLNNSVVYNLSNLFLQEFFEKYKSEFLPGFELRKLNEDIAVENFLSRARDFYAAKGTESSFEILFKVLYGKDIKFIKPRDYLLVPSANFYIKTKNILVEKISGGDPLLTRGNFLYQDIAGLSTATASIFNVEYRPIEGNNLYEISLDESSITGQFVVSGKTKLLEDAKIGDTTLLVDSTIGFSNSGSFVTIDDNGNPFHISYTDKTSNQFLGVSGVTQNLPFGAELKEEKFAYSYIGIGNTSKVEFRIINVIEKVDFSSTSNLRVGDKIQLSGFGRDLSDNFQFNSWIYNLPTNHTIKSITKQDDTKYRVILYDSVAFSNNETILLENQSGSTISANVISVEFDTGDIVRKYSNRILIQINDLNYPILSSVRVKKVVKKGNHQLNYFPNINLIPSGVQNTYISRDDQYFYVTSTGIPNYTIFSTDTKKVVSTVGSGKTTLLNVTNHGFVTGESIYYIPNSETTSGISSGSYFVTSVNANVISLSYSKSDVYSKKYLEVSSGISSDLVYKFGYQNKNIKNQKLLKKFFIGNRFSSFDDKNNRTTNNREIGILVNGVEILSPTLFDENCYYGKLVSIDVTNSGRDYDVVNPPSIEILDDSGIGAKAHVNIIGQVKSVKVVSPGIGYQSKPKITISGGNGKGCVLESNLIKSRISVGFKPETSLDLLNNTITFSSNHNFDDGEEVIYNSKGNSNVLGLVDGSHYFVGIVSSKIIKLYNKFQDSINKQNEVNIVGISSGFHSIETLTSKNTITQVYVKESGSGYSNRNVKIPSVLSVNNVVGVNTFDSYFYAPNHGFNSGELVVYSCTGTPISGISTNDSYYIKVLDNNKFKLSLAGSGTSISRENYLKEKYVKLSSLGIGTHIISYPPITINVESLSAIGSTEIVQPILEPVILGSIDSVYLEDGGVSYGTTNIINYHRRPYVGFSSITSECVLKPIIVNGSIVDVKIINKGRGYRKDSDILINGKGSFAEIEPVIESGRVVSVNILNGGVGYDSSDTVMTVVNRGRDAKFLPNVYEWKINQVVKSSKFISNEDDGITYPSKNPKSELQFINFYIPKKLRYQLGDNFTENEKEISGSKTHSPILGYAYDGCPIYGPYGYDKPSGGTIRQIKTSYELRANLDPGIRPSGFEAGYFVNDYVYTGSGDLDESNGRWCVTPQYPNGVYAYFTSVRVDDTLKSIPEYPYAVGEYFKFSPISENFLPSFNQDIDISKLDVVRNIGPYYINKNNSSYELINKVDQNLKQEFRVSDIQFSGITSVSIFNSGIEYQVDDRVLLNNQNTSGSGANIVVSKISGTEVSKFSVVENKLENVNFDIKSRKVICNTFSPHNILNGETVIISGISTITSSSLQGPKKVFVQEKTVDLMENIPSLVSSGYSTSIVVKDVSGFEPNSYIGIGTEILLVTRVSPELSKLFVNRIQNSGIHSVGVDSVRLLPNKFEFSLDNPSSDITFGNYVTFFDPKETVGTGTTGAYRNIVGFNTITSRFIPERSIYIPEHRFYTGQQLIYDCGVGGTSLTVSNVGSGVSFKLIPGQTVYAVNFGANYIGLSTIGFTSTSGIGTNLNSLVFLDFNSSSIGFAHSLSTVNPKITGTVERFSGIVTTSSKHNLSTGDLVELNIENNELYTIKLFYNSDIRKITTSKVTVPNTSVTINESSITIPNTTFSTGDKVIYTSTNPISGLQNNGIYYIYKDNINKIKLCEYRSDIAEAKIVNFSSVNPGTSHDFALINPPINYVKGDIINFDISDSSLSDLYLQFYEDSNFTRDLEVIGNSSSGFAIKRSGTSGTTDAYVRINTSIPQVPDTIYYNFRPLSPSDERKNQISSDSEVIGANKLVSNRHILVDKFIISVGNENTFTFNLKKSPSEIEKVSYNNSKVTYNTTSKSAYGSISALRINFTGSGYKKLPFVSSIETEKGKNAVIKLISPKVGRVEKYDRVKDGFDYPTDPTLSPYLSVPSIIGIKDIRTISSVGILTGGRNYNTPPVLIVKDNSNIKLSAELTGSSVTKVNILNNVSNLKEPLEITPIYNSNGYDIDAIQVSGDDVTLELLNQDLISTGYGKTEFVFPFAIGDEIFIEGCRLTPSTKSKANFNSSSYNYRTFTVTGISTVNSTVSYSMSGISTGSFGTYDDSITLGYVCNKKDLPVFEMILSDDSRYLSGEKVTSDTFSAVVMENGWDNDLNQMRVTDSFGELNVDDKILGTTSRINGTVDYIDTFRLNAYLGLSRDKVTSYESEVGVLNDFQQRISDNFYYQKFSYSIKSEIPYDTWKESVRSIIHPSGFKEFSDLEVYTNPTLPEVQSGIAKSTNMKPSVLSNESTLLVNIDSISSMNRKENFALSYEEDQLDDGSVERIFLEEGVALRDFIVNKTNKVLLIDDISDQFNGISTNKNGAVVVGLTTFKLKNKGTPLFKREFDSSDPLVVDLSNNCFILPNHNFQSGQELIYNYNSGSPISIAVTTAAPESDKDILFTVGNLNGTAVYENGIGGSVAPGGMGNPITGPIIGVSTTLVPPGPSSQIFVGVPGFTTTGVGTGIVVNILVTYNVTTGVPISTSMNIQNGGRGYNVGEIVSIAGTFLGGTSPANNLRFTISKTGPSGIQTEANKTYTSVPSIDGKSLFNVSRDNTGYISTVSVVNGGFGYASTSTVSIAGTYLGGTNLDNITFTPALLGTNKLPKSLFVYKIDDNKFRVSGLSSSIFVDFVGFGTGLHSLQSKNTNDSVVITIDGIIQSPLRRKSLNVTLTSNISSGTTTIIPISSGISSLATGDIININSEYLLVKNIGVAGTNLVGVERGYLGSTSGIHTVGSSCTVMNGDFNIVGDQIYFTAPPYGKIGPVGLETGSIFGGRVFSRRFDPSQPKDKNLIIDDISLSFTGIAATEFTLKVNGQSTNTLFNDVNDSTEINNIPFILINNVFQNPSKDYTIDGSSENVIRFLSGTPSAGKISKVAITTGFGYQPLIAASGRAVVSASGTISQIVLTGGGSGYRQPPVISIASTIGSGASITANVGAGGTITSFNIINAGSGYTSTSLPTIIVGFPTGYSNLGVAYTGGTSGVGQNAKVSVVVGQGSSIISFKIDRPGIGYKVGDVLDVQGITTNPSVGSSFQPFRLTVQEVQTDKFVGFYPGQFLIFDDISQNFNGFRKKFTLSVTRNGIKEILSLKTQDGSDLDITNNVFIYINDILQIPGTSYRYSGSRVFFKEAPKSGSTCTILYYRGSSIDVEEVSPPKTIKEGDTVIISENKEDDSDTSQLDRVVKSIVSSDQFDTFTYNSLGINTDPNKLRPLTWIKQDTDKIISGALYSKARPSYRSNIIPNTRLIKNVSPTDSVVYVDNAFPLFSNVDSLSENIRGVNIVEERNISVAICTAIVSSASSVSFVNIVDGGIGYAYTSNPVVNISKSSITRKDPIKDWNFSIGILTNFQPNSITYGNVIVSVGNSSAFVVSENGSTWNNGIIGYAGTITFNSVSCGGTNIFFAAGEYAKIVKSFGYGTTVSSWSENNLVEEIIIPGLGVVNRVPTTYSGTFNDISYSPHINQWIAVGTGGSVFTASGINTSTFTSRFSSTIQSINSITYDTSRVIAVGNNGTIISSVNGEVWELLISPTVFNLNKVINANGVFIAVGDSSTIIKSISPSEFVNVGNNLSENIVDINYSQELYTILTSSGKLYYSFDLSNWILRNTGYSNNLTNIIRIPSLGLEGRYISVGSAGTAIYAEPVYNRATAVGNVTSGVVTSVTILNGGFGYSQSNPPSVLVEQDYCKNEVINSIKVVGDYGTIIGINTFIPGTPGIGTTSPKVEFVLKSENYDNSTLGVGYSSLNNYGVNYSQLSKGDYFVIFDSNVRVGHALTGITTSLGGMSNYPSSRVGTANSFIDGVYRVEDVNTNTISGVTTVSCNFAPIESSFGNYVQIYVRGENNSGVNTNGFYGRYSWSKIYDFQNRLLGDPTNFEVNTNNGLSGLSTSPKVLRTRPIL